MLLGASGTAGRATGLALHDAGHNVTCLMRPRPDGKPPSLPDTFDIRQCHVTDLGSLRRDGLRGERFDALISCMASRTGAPDDAWAIDHRAHVTALHAATEAGVRHMVLMSAICVQKPRLPFQHAKLAFEDHLIASGLRYSIVRPTALFKSLSGQIDRLRSGKPYLMFGDGRLTACKPISDGDLGRYMAGCLTDEARWNRILPIGGPGPALTPARMGAELFRLLDRPPRYRRVPVAMLDTIAGTLGLMGRVSPKMAARAHLARIGRYYATESMLHLDPAAGRYAADQTPETGSETLFDYYAHLIATGQSPDRGDHAVF